MTILLGDNADFGKAEAIVAKHGGKRLSVDACQLIAEISSQRANALSAEIQYCHYDLLGD